MTNNEKHLELENDENNCEKALLPHYVYTLVDSRDMCVFYVGKGQGKRVKEHVNEVRTSKEDDVDNNSKKKEKIKEIQDLGKVVMEVIIGRFETEAEAFSVESVLIHNIYDLDNLTNEIGGHGNVFIRKKGDFDEIPGIDIPSSTVSGDFRDSKLKGLTDADAYGFLESLKTDLSSNNFKWSDFSTKEYCPFNPGKSNGYLGLIVNLNGIDFIISFTKTLRLSIGIANTSETQKKLESLYSLSSPSLFTISEPKNNKVTVNGTKVDRYRDIYDIDNLKIKFKHKEISPMIGLLNQIKGWSSF